MAGEMNAANYSPPGSTGNTPYWPSEILCLALLIFAVALLLGLGWFLAAGTSEKATNTNAGAPRSGSGLTLIPEPESRVSFLAVGDIMLSRHVEDRIDRQDDPLLPFRSLAELLTSTDFNFGNLESPVSGRDNVKGRGLIFNVATKNVEGLRAYNFKIVNLANNHALDQQIAGLENTRRLLAGYDISYIGVGDSKESAWSGKVIAVNGIRIGFLGASYASINDGGVARNDYVARIEDLPELEKSIRELKSAADFVVVTMHAGIEFKRHPHPSQITFARAAVDYGADLIIGAHPHWIQTVEQYQGKYIFYSLGNFVFDANREDTSQGLAVRVVLRKPQFVNLILAFSPQDPAAELERIELIPIVIQQFSPRPANTEESRRILQKIGLTESVIRPERYVRSQGRPSDKAAEAHR